MRNKSLMVVILLTFFVFFLILKVNSISATEPTRLCYSLPSYVNQLESYYDSVEIVKDPCYPRFSFKSPTSYSKFGVSYKINDFFEIKANTLEEYDVKLRNIISERENCPGVPKYLELATKLRISGYPFSDFSPDYFLDRQGKNCKDLSWNINYLERERIINSFFIQKQFGDYSVCQQDKTPQTVYGGGGNPNPDTVPKGISFYVKCDNRVKERIRLITNNNELLEAYFENSGTEVYRKIYPEDVLLRKRNPAWEREQYLNRLRILAAVTTTFLFVISLIFLKKKKLFIWKK